MAKIKILSREEILDRLPKEEAEKHCGFSVRIVCDRGVSHELVRHRLCSFSQESTRYVGYRSEIKFIIPPWVNLKPFGCEGWYLSGENELGPTYGCQLVNEQLKPNTAEWTWAYNMVDTARDYNELLRRDWRPEQARSVLPNSLATEIVMTGNLRQWRTVFKQRSSKACHPQMLEIIIPLLSDIKKKIPIVFDDIIF